MRDNNKKILLQFLGSEQPFKHDSLERTSVLIHILQECRLITKRNPLTGVYDEEINFQNDYSGRWVAAIGYLCALDMIGNAFRKGINNPKKTYSNIPYAIESFASTIYTKCDIDAIVALRNSFAHNLSLLNIPDKIEGNEDSLQRFGVDALPLNPNVFTRRRSNPWDGIAFKKNYSDSSNRTDINLYALGNLVEEILKNLIDGINNGTIEIQEIEEVYEKDKIEKGKTVKQKSKKRIDPSATEDYKLISFLNKYTFVITND